MARSSLRFTACQRIVRPFGSRKSQRKLGPRWCAPASTAVLKRPSSSLSCKGSSAAQAAMYLVRPLKALRASSAALSCWSSGISTPRSARGLCGATPSKSAGEDPRGSSLASSWPPPGRSARTSARGGRPGRRVDDSQAPAKSASSSSSSRAQKPTPRSKGRLGAPASSGLWKPQNPKFSMSTKVDGFSSSGLASPVSSFNES